MKKMNEELKSEIWSCKTITFDVKKGTSLSCLIEALNDVFYKNQGLVVPADVQFSFSEMTSDEVNEHYSTSNHCVNYNMRGNKNG